MADPQKAQVIGENGLKGTVLGPSEASPNEIAIALEDGREISVPPSALILQPGGVWRLQNDNSHDPEPTSSSSTIIPVVSEELDISKRKRATGSVRVEKETIEHDETVSMPLTRETAEVKRVIIGKPVDGPLPIRREGDTIIMPVVEEVAFVEKRMILKEEIHITRRRTTQQHQETVTLQTEQADVKRTGPSGRPVAADEMHPVSASSAIPARSQSLAPEERSILDPTKARPNILGPRQKPVDTSKRRKFLDKE